MYENWINYVKKTVPKDQLLIFNAKDGVDKLAKFLEIKTPSWKLPHMKGEIFIDSSYDKNTQSHHQYFTRKKATKDEIFSIGKK